MYKLLSAHLKPVSRYTTGFTILELLIAMTVFSVMLLVATTGVIQVGRTYYKGITTTKTQETARSVINEISEAVQIGSDNNFSRSAAGAEGPNGEQAVCVGKLRYTYLINAQIKQPYNLTSTASPGPTAPHALWVDVLKDGVGCPALLDLSQQTPLDRSLPPGAIDTTASAGRQRELLAQNMRLTAFDINPVGDRAFNIRAKVTYGDHDLTDATGTTCLPTGLGGQFCAVSDLSTFVKKRL